MAGITLIYFGAFYVRGMGRVFNPVYRQFIDILTKSSKLTPDSKLLLSNYDFSFGAWPIDFSVLGREDVSFILSQEEKTNWQAFKDLPKHIGSWILLHSFGIKLIYPGSIQLLQASISGPLQEGRAQQILEKGGKRFKVVASDGNIIDTMFFDRRGQENELGKTLVISCDGNAGFYEIGVLGTPLEKGFSVLGWNHPGFGGSTGTPFPQFEVNAADAVMQFALERLGFIPEQIIIHGWSIGGFTASFLAMSYPDVRGVVIDASFDKLLPLAVPRMPRLLEPLVKYAVKNFVSLEIAEQLKRYPGPVRIVRRAIDEMVTTDMEFVKCNRGNDLLVQLLSHRYPNLCREEAQITALWNFLASISNVQKEILSSLPTKQKEAALQAFLEGDRTTFPSDLGDDNSDLTSEEKTVYLLSLADIYLEEVDSSHCTPLPTEKFNIPWNSPENK